MAKIPGLQLKGLTYYLRVRVPQDLIALSEKEVLSVF